MKNILTPLEDEISKKKNMKWIPVDPSRLAAALSGDLETDPDDELADPEDDRPSIDEPDAPMLTEQVSIIGRPIRHIWRVKDGKIVHLVTNRPIGR